jgi:hypothetical protein
MGVTMVDILQGFYYVDLSIVSLALSGVLLL